MYLFAFADSGTLKNLLRRTAGAGYRLISESLIALCAKLQAVDFLAKSILKNNFVCTVYDGNIIAKIGEYRLKIDQLFVLLHYKLGGQLSRFRGRFKVMGYRIILDILYSRE